MITIVPGELVVPTPGWLRACPEAARYVIGLVVRVKGQAIEVIFTAEDGSSEVRIMWRSLVERVK